MFSRTLFICCLLNVSFYCASQSRIVFNDDVRMVMDGGVFLVVDNGSANAIATAGTADGNIVSEDEDNKVRWNIGTATGNYTVPFRSSPTVSNQGIPFSLDITVAGTGTGSIDFSTYETATDANTPYPSMVTHMLDAATATTDNSLFVADRFWLVDAFNYTTRPTVDMTITYVDNASELAVSNLLVENNLVAQRFNSNTSEWNGASNLSSLFYGNGTLNVANRTLGPFSVAPADFFEAWILVDVNHILPINMLNFDVTCNG